MRLPLFKMRSSILARVEEKFPFPKLHVQSARKKQTAQSSCLVTIENLRGLMKQGVYSAADTVVPINAALTDRCLGAVRKCDLAGMNMQYIESVDKVLFDQSGGDWVEGEQMRLHSEIRNLKSAVGNTVRRIVHSVCSC